MCHCSLTNSLGKVTKQMSVSQFHQVPGQINQGSRIHTRLIWGYIIPSPIWWGMWIFWMPGRPMWVGVLAYIRKQCEDTPWVYGKDSPLDRWCPCQTELLVLLLHVWRELCCSTAGNKRFGTHASRSLMSSHYPTKEPTWFNNIII